jgi:hypothetical protein
LLKLQYFDSKNKLVKVNYNNPLISGCAQDFQTLYGASNGQCFVCHLKLGQKCWCFKRQKFKFHHETLRPFKTEALLPCFQMLKSHVILGNSKDWSKQRKLNKLYYYSRHPKAEPCQTFEFVRLSGHSKPGHKVRVSNG